MFTSISSMLHQGTGMIGDYLPNLDNLNIFKHDKVENKKIDIYEIINFDYKPEQRQEPYIINCNKKYYSKQYKEAKKQQQEDDEIEEYTQYVVQQDDTLFGLALKFNINPGEIKSINQMCSDISLIPGMTINLPFQEPAIEAIQINTSKPQIQNNIETEIQQDQKNIIKQQFQYCTNYGNILGLITINNQFILFDPDILSNNASNHTSQMKIIKFQACIEISDIKEIKMLQIPNYEHENESDQYLQIVLKNMGKSNLNKEQIQNIKAIQQKNDGIAILFFKIVSNDSSKIQQIINKINQFIQMNQKKQQNQAKSITMVPFFDLNVNVIEKNNQKDKKQIKDLIPQFIPCLNTDSGILNSNLISQINNNIPFIYRIKNWSLIYSTKKHGLSFHTLLNHCYKKGPCVLVIKDFNKYIFGAYCSDYFEVKHKFYGNGETFIFTFKDQQKIQSYFSKENDYFIYTCPKGIGIGCGDKFGLYFNSDLYEGHSNWCSVFDNEQLSKKQDFGIECLEIWHLDQYEY